MNLLQEIDICCVYCGETISILADPSVEIQEYTEDCQVCCRPMIVEVAVDQAGICRVAVHREDES